MKEKTLRMTQGDPVRLLVAFAVPMLIGNIFQQVYNLVDSVIVGRFVGAGALAAVGATNSVSFLFFSICNGIGSGGGIVTAQFFGAGDTDKIKRAMANSAYIMFGTALVMSVIAYLAAEAVLGFMNTPKDIMADAVVYMHMSCVGVPLIAVYNYVSSMLRALGDSRTPLYFLIFSCFLNVGLDILCVYTLGLGVFGAALATIIAQVAAGAGCLLYAVRTNSYFRLQKEHFKADRNILWGAVRMGVPLALQYSMIAASSMALQRVVNDFGMSAVAAFTATGRIEQLVHQPYGSLCMALSTYCGQNLGGGRLDRVKLGYRKGLVLVGVFSLVLLALMQLGGEGIVKIFVDDPEVIRLGARAIRITSWFYFPLGMINVIRGMMNGVGDAMFAFVNGIVEVIGRILIPRGLTRIPALGVWGIWWSAGIVWLVSAFFCLLRYLSWKRKTGAGADGRTAAAVINGSNGSDTAQ